MTSPSDKIREKIMAGVLPSHACEVTWYGPGSGQPCHACELPVLSSEIEVECDLPSGQTHVRFHRTCFDAWERERELV
jgi:hypothetical protein